MAIYDRGEQAVLEEAHESVPNNVEAKTISARVNKLARALIKRGLGDQTPDGFETSSQPLRLREVIVLGRNAIQEHNALPNYAHIQNNAEWENQLYGQSKEQDRLIKYGRHSLQEIRTGIPSTYRHKI